MSKPAGTAKQQTDETVTRDMARLTRRSFAVGGVAALAGLAGGTWLRTRADDDGVIWPLRRMLELNQRISEAYFNPRRLAPTFDASAAAMPRANGHIGLESKFEPAAWRLNVETDAAKLAPRQFALAEIKALPRIEMVTELKCIEGWSTKVQWAGARLGDFAAKFGLAGRAGGVRKFVGLSTPDKAYYVGLDIASALHPQTLLCYEMNGQPLSPDHGAPLRLVITVKYGIKHLKRIGTIRFSNQRPADYWAERGYDWFAGH